MKPRNIDLLFLVMLVLFLESCANTPDQPEVSLPHREASPVTPHPETQNSEHEDKDVVALALEKKIFDHDQQLEKLKQKATELGKPPFLCATGLAENLEEMDLRKTKLEATAPDSEELKDLNQLFQDYEEVEASYSKRQELATTIEATMQSRAKLVTELNALRD